MVLKPPILPKNHVKMKILGPQLISTEADSGVGFRNLHLKHVPQMISVYITFILIFASVYICLPMYLYTDSNLGITGLCDRHLTGIIIYRHFQD